LRHIKNFFEPVRSLQPLSFTHRIGDIIPIATNDDREFPQHSSSRSTTLPHFNNHTLYVLTDGSISKMTAPMNILKFYLSLPIVMLSSSLVGHLSPVPSLRFWSRAITCYCSLLLCASYGVIASILLRIARRPTLSQWTAARCFRNVMSPLIGWKFDIQGEEILAKHRPAVFISNHQRY
jgi:hypothetical protein